MYLVYWLSRQLCSSWWAAWLFS